MDQGLTEVFERFAAASDVQRLVQTTEGAGSIEIGVSGLSGSMDSMVCAALFKKLERPALIVKRDKEEAAYFLNDMEALIGKKDVLFFPASYRRPYEIEQTDNSNVLLRAEVLNRLSSRKRPALIVSYPNALCETVVTRSEISRNTLHLKVGDSIGLEFLNETLFTYQFERVEYVYRPGEFSVRGGIVDVFSFSNDLPYRIEFFGEEVDSIRLFDPSSQLSTESIKQLQILPNLEDKAQMEKRQSLLEFMRSKTWLWMDDAQGLMEQLDRMTDLAKDAFEQLEGETMRSRPEDLFVASDRFSMEMRAHLRLKLGTGENEQLEFSGSPQPSFNKQFDLFSDRLNELSANGLQNYLVCSTARQVERFEAIMEDIGKEVDYQPVLGNIHAGFIDKNSQTAVFTDHQLFERFKKFRIKSNRESEKTLTLKELNSLQYGDFVTHIDHGVGKFGGLQKIEVNGKMQEAIKLQYKDSDVLYVSIHSLHKISRYSGKEGTQPNLHKLGSGTWKKLKQKTKTRVRELAFDLIKLYAKRRSAKGHAFPPDTYLQHELEASFVYEDTPDQVQATADVKADMERSMPMDRLICGDVGFGKTEIALRAAFKAVADSKQVAVLVPTTLLAFQHYRTFSKRLKDFPCRVEYLNRFRTAKEQRETLKALAEGKVDIVIGTHRLVGKDVQFKDLGLMIIDEEQKFGVSVKDKLKTLKVNVDTLTLTATPIPRTLQFSLMAARDLSIMTTPPANRQPIDTQLIPFEEARIRDAIAFELERGGQVFFVHNRVENIREVAGMINRIIPDARVAIGHGQMDGKKLEELLLGFMEGRFDVLVSTTIVENGLDVPNANTILIHQAQNFGLSDLHQMRGRVGRSNRKAFCYLIAPPQSHMTDEARKRLQAIEQFSDLGSGFNIAMRDLEIRGAGDLLGGEQSGFISDMGFDMYQKILSEAVRELKEQEFKELYDQESTHILLEETQIDTDLELLIPDDYVNQIEERLRLYQTLNALKTEEELQEFASELKDRFGALPETVLELLNSLRLRWKGRSMGFEKLVLKQRKFIAYFIADGDHPYFSSGEFQSLLMGLKSVPNAQMKERNGKLSLVFPEVDSIEQASELLSRLVPSPSKP